mgnify:CR=1 FL=1
MPKRKADNPHFSQSISDMISMLTEAQKDYVWNSQEVKRCDQLTQDFLHSLELDGLDYEGRAKVATQLALCRKERREHKDMVISLEPLAQFVESEKGKQMLNLMREALGKTRKIEQYMESRAYYNRVLPQKEVKTNS